MIAKSTDLLIRSMAEALIDQHDLYPSNRDLAVERLTQEISVRLVRLASCNLVARDSIRDIIYSEDDPEDL